MIFIVKIILGCVLLYFIYLFITWLLILREVGFYEKQGVEIVPGAKAFLLSNLYDFIAHKKQQSQSPVPLKSRNAWLMDYKFGNGVIDSFKPEEHEGCLLTASFGKCTLLINAPEMV